MTVSTYRTSRAAASTRGLVRNAVLTGMGAALALWAWFLEGGAAFAIFAVVLALIFAVILKTYLQSTVPLEITPDSVIIRTLFTSEIPLAKISKLGVHPTRKLPSLTFDDPAKGQSGDVALPWMFIAEPQDEVVRRLEAALAGRSRA